jgi:hypothetical protein
MLRPRATSNAITARQISAAQTTLTVAEVSSIRTLKAP